MEEVPYTSPRQLLVVEEGRYGSGSARQLLVVEEGRYGSGEEKGEAERFLEGLEEVEEEEGEAKSEACAKKPLPHEPSDVHSRPSARRRTQIARAPSAFACNPSVMSCPFFTRPLSFCVQS